MKFWNKTISILLIHAFLLSSLPAGALQPASATTSDSLTPGLTAKEMSTNPQDVIISRDCGIVKSKFMGKSGKLIVHIQDAHCNYEAQTNIAKIIEGLVKNNGLSFVSVEGADGAIDTSWFKAFPDAEVRKEVANYFMKKGEITGPEFLSITTDYPIKLFGAETREYYIQNLNAFTESYPLKDETEKYLNGIKAVLNRLQGFIYNDELKAMDSRSREHEAKKIQFNDYVRFLQDEAERHKINLRQYENLFKLVNVLIYEKKIDFNVTDKERSAVIDELSKTLQKDAMTELVNRSIAFKVGKISSSEYYDYIKSLAAMRGIELAKKYPNLSNYIIYNSVYSKIDNEKLFNDIKELETAIKEKLFQNEDQRILERLSRHIDTLLGLINIKLLNGEFEYYKTHKEEFASESFTGFIRAKSIQFGLAYEVEPPTDTIESGISKLEDFYAIAIKRDRSLVENTIEGMAKAGQNIAVLVTGGFHSEGMAKLLEERGISYVVICPNITKDVPTPYIQVLTNQRASFEDILVGAQEPIKQNMLAPALISWAAGLTPSELKKLAEAGAILEGRTKDAEDAWIREHLSLWLGKALKYTGLHRMAHDKAVLKDAYRMAAERAALAAGFKQDKIGPLVKEIMAPDAFNSAFDAVYDSAMSAPLVVGITQDGRDEDPSATGEQGAVTVTGVALTPEQKIEVNEKIRVDFESGKAELFVIEYGLHIYAMPSLEGLTYLVAHPGRGGEAFDHLKRRIYMSPSRLNWYNGVGPAVRAQFLRHEIMHLDNPDWTEAQVTEEAPLGLVLAAVIDTMGTGEAETDMDKHTLQYLFNTAVDGGEEAYKAIVDRVGKEKIIAYLEPLVKDGLKDIPEDLFGFGKGYDIRGNAQPITGGAVDLTPINLYVIGKLLGTYYANAGDKMLVTGDIRLHTPILRYVLALGASSVGVNVEYAPDFLTTGAHNLLSTENEGDYKVMAQISGSHGVPQKNGLKIKAFLDKKDGKGRMILEPLYAERLEGLYWKNKAGKERQLELRKVVKPGDMKEIVGLAEKTIEVLDKVLPSTEKDEISVVDPRAGAGGPIMTGVLEKRGFTIIDMDACSKEESMPKIRAMWNNPKRQPGKFRVAVMLNAKPDGKMGRGIWDPSKPEALKDTIELVNLINSSLLAGMPKAFGAVYDGDTDRITAIREDGVEVPAFEMTLPFYQRFLLSGDNQEVMMKLAKAGCEPIRIVCDVRANSKLLSLIDRVNKELQDKTGIHDRNIIEGWFITTGYPPQLGFMNNRIAELDKFVDSNPTLKNNADFMEKLAGLKGTYFTAEASGHNFFHISERYPNRVCDCAIAGFFTLLHIRETLAPAELLAQKQEPLLVNLFANFPVAYSSAEIRVPIPNAIKIETAMRVGAWMKEKYEAELKPYSEPVQEYEYLIQPKDAGYVTVSGFKIQLKDGRSALVRWSNTGEELTTIFEGRDLASLISTIKEITERLREETSKGLKVSNLDKEIARLENIKEKEDAGFIGQKLHTPLDAKGDKARAAGFMKGGYNKDGKTANIGYGVEDKASIDGSFAIAGEGSQGYFVDGGRQFLATVKDMRDFFARRAQILGKPIKYVIKPGIGGQHTPFQGIAEVFQVVDIETGVVVGEYELGKNYEEAIGKVLAENGADWDQIAVVPSSKSGSTDETMMIFSEVFYTLLKKIAERDGLAGEKFAETVFNTLHDINFIGGAERKGADLFKGFNLTLLTDNLNAIPGFKTNYEQVKGIFRVVLGNMFFETTNRPDQSRLSAFIQNSGLGKELGKEYAPGFGAMFDNVGERWTADLHMMTFLAYHGMTDAEIQAYWQSRYDGIEEVRAGTHLANSLANKTLDEGVTDVALVVPDELFWFGKAMEQNRNESIWQNGFANLVAVKASMWNYQKPNYANKPNRLVIDMTGAGLDMKGCDVFSVPPPYKTASEISKDKLAIEIGKLFTTFYGATYVIGTRLSARALAREGYTWADVDINDLENPATKIFQRNLYLRQPYVELGKGLLEKKLGDLQKSGPEAIQAELAKIQDEARQGKLISNIKGLGLPETVNDRQSLAQTIASLIRLADKEGRKFVPFIYLEGEKYYELRDHLITLGIEWVMQGTGDQHISYQQVLTQPKKFLPFIISFIPPKESLIQGRPAIGFSKGYLNNVSPNIVRDLFADASYKALTEPRKDESGKDVKGALGAFLRIQDTRERRAMFTQSFDEAVKISTKAPIVGAAQLLASGASAEEKPVEGVTRDQYIHDTYVKEDAAALRQTLVGLGIDTDRVKKNVLILYDTSLDQDLDTTHVARAGEVAVNKYMNGAVTVIRGTGKALIYAPAVLKALNAGDAIVTIAGDATLKEIGRNELRNFDKIINVQNPDNRHIPVIGLYDLALKIAYDLGDERILECLNRIAIRGPNDPTPFTMEDIRKGVIRILPKIRPVNMAEAVEAYKAAQAALVSL